MKISICILTHNRPELFKRSITSVINATTDIEYEVLVNNDSADVHEHYIERGNVHYYYKTSYDLSDIYRYLFDASSGEFVYFLEDDDYIHQDFFNTLDLNFDINYMLYTSIDHITYYGPREAIKRQRLNNRLVNVSDYKTFIDSFDDKYFQLSQILFRKKCVKGFPTGNNIRNDYMLFSECIDNNSTIKYIDKQLWTQTTDGRDNISFEELNKDERFN